MGEPEVNSSEKADRRLTPSGARLILGATAAGCAAVLLAIPQAVIPYEGPGLRLDRNAVAAVVDSEASREAPRGEHVERLLELYAEQGRVETTPGESRQAFTAREVAIREAIAHLDDDEVDALRAAAMQKLEPALGNELSDEEEAEVLGSFPRMLERYDAAEEGYLIAPMFVVRTLFKGRWNGIHRRELTEGFSDVELQAYWGWLGLHAESAPLARRLEGIARYARAGGGHADEARAFLAFLNEQEARASAEYAAIYEKRGDLRARNHALGTGVQVESF